MLSIKNGKPVETGFIISITLLLSWRICLMIILALTDNTESRYALIAQLTLTHDFWLMPHIELQQPFFAKPPLAIWLTALAGKLFGISAFSMRLPALFSGVITLWCIWQLSNRLSRAAQIFCLFAALASPLFFISIGAVMTDAVQMACTTIALLCIQRCLTIQNAQYWRLVFWLMCGLGLLIKGLATLALIGLPLILFCLTGGSYRRIWQALWDSKGVLLCILISIPWYSLAEYYYPGFLQYLFIGEHVMRFIDPNWSGDQFGHPHHYPIGMIWVFWIAAILPWIWIFIQQIYLKLHPPSWRQLDDTQRLLWCACLAPLLFFTLARNIIGTYPLTAIPPFIVLVGYWYIHKSQIFRIRLVLMMLIIVIVTMIAGSLWLPKMLETRSARTLIEVFHTHTLPGRKLIYSFPPPYSAYFYSQGNIDIITQEKDLQSVFKQPGSLIVLPAQTAVLKEHTYTVRYRDNENILIQIKN